MPVVFVRLVCCMRVSVFAWCVHVSMMMVMITSAGVGPPHALPPAFPWFSGVAGVPGVPLFPSFVQVKHTKSAGGQGWRVFYSHSMVAGGLDDTS